MSIRTLAAAIAVAASIGAASPLLAADLDYDVKGSPYDDPRYSDIYRHPPPPAPYPPAPVYREERYAPPPPPVYYERDARVQCLPHHVINDRLQGRGWHDFHGFQVQGNVTHVRARRPSGRLFELTVDRCSGEILETQLVDARRAEIQPPPYQGGYPGYQGGYQGDWRYRDNRYGY